jgi:hypothetical protein
MRVRPGTITVIYTDPTLTRSTYTYGRCRGRIRGMTLVYDTEITRTRTTSWYGIHGNGKDDTSSMLARPDLTERYRYHPLLSVLRNTPPFITWTLDLIRIMVGYARDQGAVSLLVSLAVAQDLIVIPLR